MPFTLLIIGAVLLISSVRNTQDDLFKLVKGDMTGQHNFIYWIVVVLSIGAIGYIPKLKPLSNLFLVLIVIVLFLKNGGFFDQFTKQIYSTNEPKVKDGSALFTGPITSF